MAERQPLILIAPMLLALGCAGVARTDAPRMSDLASDGDERFRASQELVIEGLAADERLDGARARSRYERALQIDASNPWVYLALARHYVEAGESSRALSHLDRAETLLESEASGSPGAGVHLTGLRGAALALEGDYTEARALLDSAARSAPGVWGDGQLSASELR